MFPYTHEQPGNFQFGWDNAVQERFFRSLKSEYLNALSFINHQAVVAAVTITFDITTTKESTLPLEI
jgi:hypothetical protein